MSDSSRQFVMPAKARNLAILAAAIGVAAVVIGWFFNPDGFYRAYLHSWLFWTDVSLGCMGLTMVIHLLGGAWGMAVRRLAESAAMVLPVMAVLFVPIGIAVASGHLYPWANASVWQSDPVLVHRRPYLNSFFFLARAGGYAIGGTALAFLLWYGSWSSDASRGARRADWLYPVSGVGLVLFILIVGLFASTDWIMSLEPDYKSTVFGFIIVAGQGLSGMCALIVILAMLPHRMLARPIDDDVWDDLASVLLTLAMFWCYLVACQFVVNWMGNDQPQVGWYFRRMNNGWYVLNWILVGLLLFLPLVLLLFRRIKRNPRAMLILAVVMLATRALDGFWMVNAAGVDPAPLLRDRFSWMDIVLPIGIGGVWVLVFAWVLGRGPVMVEPAEVAEGAPHAA